MKKHLMLFKALSDETRYKIIEPLLDKERCVCEIYPYVKRTQPTVSVQLAKLESWGIIKSRRDGKKVYYNITNRAVYDLFNVLGIRKKNSIRTDCCRSKKSGK